jgi:hypothetical protein
MGEDNMSKNKKAKYNHGDRVYNQNSGEIGRVIECKPDEVVVEISTMVGKFNETWKVKSIRAI